MNDVYPKPRYQQNRWAKSIRMTVPGGIHVYLLSEQVVQLPLAVLQATSIRAVDDPNQPIGLPTIRKRGVPVNVSEMQLLRHRTARAYWYTFSFFYVCYTIAVRLTSQGLFVFTFLHSAIFRNMGFYICDMGFHMSHVVNHAKSLLGDARVELPTSSILSVLLI